jgi:hypothetical protein
MKIEDDKILSSILHISHYCRLIDDCLMVVYGKELFLGDQFNELNKVDWIGFQKPYNNNLFTAEVRGFRRWMALTADRKRFELAFSVKNMDFNDLRMVGYNLNDKCLRSITYCKLKFAIKPFYDVFGRSSFQRAFFGKPGSNPKDNLKQSSITDSLRAARPLSVNNAKNRILLRYSRATFSQDASRKQVYS